MAKLSISSAWSETASFVKQEAGTLFLISFGLLALPGILLQIGIPYLFGGGLMMTPGVRPDPGLILHALPWFALLVIPLVLLNLWGTLTLNVLALRRETVAGAAFALAARRILPVFGAGLLIGIGAVVLMAPVIAIVAFVGRAGHVGLLALLLLAAFVLIFALWIRLMLINAVGAAEPIGPIEILRRSWALTAGHFWKLLGFLLLMFVVYMVLTLVVGGVGGILVVLAMGPPLPGTAAAIAVSLLSGVLQAVCLLYFLVLVARIYAQLSGDESATARVFD
jgi:hypothetical protein